MARKTGSHSEITGPKIRAEAQRLFARYGFAAVSMRQIAGAVGVQAGALYLYTPDKEALLFDLLKTHMDELIAAWRAEPAGGDAHARLERFVRFHIRFNLERAEAVFLSYMELRNLSPENFAVIEGLRKAYETELEEILKAGQDEGAFLIPDTKLATMAIIAMLTGVNTWFREGGRLSRAMVADIYWDMVRKSVGA
ncbi:TetR/AcrR family transcriptional regulator [Thioclava nitratireducens]|uniref:TetR/AcrR family transcriptional regulator n=1 Tax=Thioclava nitratireducens TaxID=1915078 RepID=UPI00248105B8|nr:TetR/AcrR family transcriptional regulator [Thioclava nitratireducens]WGT50968.1 TetR/AcrR family transcriptional regulator [Thioclava nitratireducens]